MGIQDKMSRRTFVTYTGALMAGMAAFGAGLAPSAARADEAAGGDNPLFAKPGTYTGVGIGRNGDVSVTLTVTESAIENIEVDSKETITIGKEAINALVDQVVKHQSIMPDTISGATFSSVAFYKALDDAIEQAGGDRERLDVSIPKATPQYVTEADLIVVGSGGAGMTAARRAMDDGVSIIVLEKSGTIGGNTNCTAVGPNAAGSKTREKLGSTYTVEQMTADQSEDPLARPELAASLAKNSGEMIDWYAESCGMEFELDEHNETVVKMKSYFPGLEGHDAPSSGVLAIDTTHSQLKENPDVHIYTNIRAMRLIKDGDRVAGVIAKDKLGNKVTFTGRGVILATGGYSFNHAIIDAANPGLTNAGTDQVAPVTGDGILMAQELGADVVDLGELENSGFVCTTLRVAQYMGEADCGWNPDVHRGIPRGFFVNLSGERFVSETDFKRENFLAQQDGRIFHIFPANEETVRDGVERFIKLGVVKRASSPQALATALRFDGEGLADTLEEWNKGAKSGKDLKYKRDDEGVVPIDETDLCGYAFKNTIHYCMGGVLIDPDAHVLDTEGGIIPGLYAAGETTGGVHGGNRRDGSGIADSLTFGFVAGRTAAGEILAS